MVRVQTSFACLLVFVSCAAAVPSDCLSRSNIESVAECLEDYTIPKLTYIDPCSALANPASPDEETQWNTAVTDLMETNTPGDCTSHTLGPLLSSDFAFALYPEPGSTKSFCLLYETATSSADPTRFKRGWGFVIVPANGGDIVRPLHFSAPHPLFDQNTVKQAAAMLGLTGGKSMIATGRHRQACSKPTTCSGSGQAIPNYQTDPAHDSSEPMFKAMVAIHNWQDANGGCPAGTCGYLQFHGNIECSYDAFLSHGRATTCYTDPNIPVRRLKASLDIARPGGTHGYPGTDPVCNLTATRNIYGRLVNGIPMANICTTISPPVPPCSALGQFVHIEQDAAARDSSQYAAWADAINSAYPVA